jgi:hypothetical protein
MKAKNELYTGPVIEPLAERTLSLALRAVKKVNGFSRWPQAFDLQVS